MSASLGTQAWVFVMKSDDTRSWSANRGYDDSAGIYYSYDSNVGRHKRVSVGDLVVVREDDHVAGWGFVEHIEVDLNATKEITRCPKCRRTNFYRRKTVRPHNVCSMQDCKHEFDDDQAIRTFESVTSFRAFYANTWTEAARSIRRNELEEFLLTKDPFNAIRPIDAARLPELLDRISGRDVDIAFDINDQEVAIILGGHTETIVRRRRGQREFRFHLLEQFGEVCAVSGGQPPQVLEAAHLYSYASRPEHERNGGLLLRRDVHSLFDANLLTVNPASLQVEIAPRLRSFSSYAPFEGRGLEISSPDKINLALLEAHFEKSKRVFQHN